MSVESIEAVRPDLAELDVTEHWQQDPPDVGLVARVETLRFRRAPGHMVALRGTWLKAGHELRAAGKRSMLIDLMTVDAPATSGREMPIQPQMISILRPAFWPMASHVARQFRPDIAAGTLRYRR